MPKHKYLVCFIFFKYFNYCFLDGNNSTQRQYITETIQGQKTNSNVTLQSPPSYHANPHNKTLYQSRQPDCSQTQIIQNNSTVYTEIEHLGNQNNDIEFRKYSIKQYHLQRTIKALVYVIIFNFILNAFKQ